MADQKLTALTALATPADADLLYMVDDVAGTPVSVMVTMTQFLTQTGDIIPRTDDVSQLGDSTHRWKRVNYANNDDGDSAGSPRNYLRGMHIYQAVSGLNNDIFVGDDNVFAGYYAQRSVLAGSTLSSNADDFTNILQGASGDGNVYVNWRASKGTNPAEQPYLSMGARAGSLIVGIYDATNALGGGGIGMSGRQIGQGALMQIDSNIWRLSVGGFGKSHVDVTEIRLGGDACEAVAPTELTGATNDDAIDLGVSTNRWKDGYFAGGVALNGITTIATPQTYNESNVTTDRTYDANATSVAELADVLGTLLVDLRAVGLVL